MPPSLVKILAINLYQKISQKALPCPILEDNSCQSVEQISCPTL